MTTVAIDANVALALVVPLPYSDRVVQLFTGWQARAVQLAVPALWGYEVASALRKAVTAGVFTLEDAVTAVRHLWALNLQEVPGTIERHRRALTWAEQLGQAVAYDAQYLVVAEELKIPFWTADRSLAAGAQAAGADWVHWIGLSG
jgi:predicted nucleic acid-binding protein